MINTRLWYQVLGGKQPCPPRVSHLVLETRLETDEAEDGVCDIVQLYRLRNEETGRTVRFRFTTTALEAIGLAGCIEAVERYE